MDPGGHSFRDADESNTCGPGEDCSTGEEIDELYDFVTTYGCDSVSPTGLCTDASGNYIPNPVNDAAVAGELKGWAGVATVVGGTYVGVEFVPVVWRWGVGQIASALCMDGDCGNEVSDVIQYAQSLQGTEDYPGIDEFTETILEEGSIVIGGLPGQSVFYSTLDSLYNAAYSAERLWSGLQVAPHSEEGYRMLVGVYRVTTSTSVAVGRTLANPRWGEGGFTQFVIKNYDKVLELIETIELY